MIKARCWEPPGHYVCTTEPGRPGCVISIEKGVKPANPNWLQSIDKRGNTIQSLSMSNRDWIIQSTSLGGRLPLFYPISLLSIHLPPKRGKLLLFWSHLLPIIFSLKGVNCIEFFNEYALLSQLSETSSTMTIKVLKVLKGGIYGLI